MQKQYLESVRQKIIAHPANFSDATLFREILSVDNNTLKECHDLIAEIRQCANIDELIICVFNWHVKIYREHFSAEMKRLRRIVETNVWATDIHNLFLPLIKVDKLERIEAAKIYEKMIFAGGSEYFYQLRKFGNLAELALAFMHPFENIEKLRKRETLDDIKLLNTLRDEFLNSIFGVEVVVDKCIFEKYAEYSLTQKLMQLNNVDEITLFLLREYIAKFPRAFSHDVKMMERMEKVGKYCPYTDYMVLDLGPLNRISQYFYRTFIANCKKLLKDPNVDNLKSVKLDLHSNILKFRNSPESMNYELESVIYPYMKTQFLEGMRKRILENESGMMEYLPNYLTTIPAPEFDLCAEWVDVLAAVEKFDELILAVFKMYLEHCGRKFSNDLALLKWSAKSDVPPNLDTDFCHGIKNVAIAQMWIDVIEKPTLTHMNILRTNLEKNVLDFKKDAKTVQFSTPTSIYDLKAYPSYSAYLNQSSPNNDLKSYVPGYKLDEEFEKLTRQTIEETKNDAIEMWQPILDTTSFDELFEKFDVLCVAYPKFSRMGQMMDVFARHGIIVHGKSAEETIALFAQDLKAMAKICFNSREAKKYLDMDSDRGKPSYETVVTYSEELDTFKSIYLGDSDLDWTDGTIYAAIDDYIEGVTPRSIERYVPENSDIKQVVLDLAEILK